MSVCLGIDVGASAVKIAAIRFSYRKTTLIGMVSRDVGPDSDLPAILREAVKSLLGEKGGMGDASAVALPGSKAAFVNLSLPASSGKALGNVLPFELEPVIPFDMAESVFDYRVLPQAPSAEKAPTLTVLCAVAPTSEVRARIDLVKSATGVEPERVGVGGFTLANLVGWAPALASAEPILLLDLGNDSSDLVVLEAGEPVFARTLSLGTRGLPPTAPKLAREVRTTVLGHRAAGGKPPTRVFLAGGGAFVS
ncbi:MAG TPA: pilus assembly protein PilM, partial [Polyangiaceae bacterium]|nr:pilus assembly protein PilM [Polyangiaceae bacterium]